MRNLAQVQSVPKQGAEALRPTWSHTVLVCKAHNISKWDAGKLLQPQCFLGAQKDRWEPRHRGLIPRRPPPYFKPALQRTGVLPQESAMLGNAWENPLLTGYPQGIRVWCRGGDPSHPLLPDTSLSGYLSISVHHKMSSFSFMKTGKCWSLPCFMEFDLVVMVLTLLN